MLGEKDRLSRNLTSRSSGRRSDECGRLVRSGGNNDLSPGESEFLRKRNLKEGGESMWRWIMRLWTSFIGHGREERWYRGRETVVGEWSSSILPF
jgi:hypothetical protein